MSGSIVGFVTRAQAGLRSPRSVSRNITPQNGGVAFHYGGPRQNISSHADCAPRWRGWQNFHMDRNGWADIAYTLGVCLHGYVFAGRGAGVRTAAQGTNDGNQRFYAVVGIWGDGETPSSVALSAMRWAREELRRTGNAGTEVRPHSHFRSTACPGNPVRSWLSGGMPASATEFDLGDRVLQQSDPLMRGADVKEWQSLINQWADKREITYVHSSQKIRRLTTDGIYGTNTRVASSNFVNREMNVQTSNPRIGPKTIQRMIEVLREQPKPKKRYNMLVYGKRGTPDYNVAAAVHDTRPAGVVTSSLDEAKAAVERGEPVVAVGGPAAGELPDGENVTKIVGSNAADTARRLSDFAVRGWK